MTLSPLFAVPAVIPLHAIAAMAAFVLGLAQFALPKGGARHRAMGWTWVLLMAAVALSSFRIHTIRQFGGFSVIHGLSLATLALLPLAVIRARRGQIGLHRRGMILLFCGALMLAGLFTLVPGRLMHAVLFGLPAPCMEEGSGKSCG